MAKLIYSLLCRRAIVDQQTNIVSFIDVIENVPTLQVPFQLPVVIAASLWEPDDATEKLIETQLLVFSPSGAVLATEISSVTLQPEHVRARIIFGIEALIMPEKGRYWVAISSKSEDGWKEVNRLPLDVMVVEPPTAVAKAPPAFPPRKRLR